MKKAGLKLNEIRCFRCGTREKLQLHHICYNPEITTWTCINCHQKIHKKHGVGSPIGKVYPEKNVKAFICLWKKGKSLTEISQFLGTSAITLGRWRDKLNLSNLDRERIPITSSFIKVLKARSIQIEAEMPRHRIATITLENGKKIKAF